MARPRSFDENAILDAAMGAFWAKGYAATSMADLYAATRLKAGSVYGAFGSKDELFRQAFERYAGHFRASLPTDATGRAAIAAWLDTQVRLATADPKRRGCLIVNSALERELHPPETLALVQARLAEIRAFFALHLATARARAEIAAGIDTEAAADGLVASVIGIMTLARAGAADTAIANVAKAAMAGLQPSAA